MYQLGRYGAQEVDQTVHRFNQDAHAVAANTVASITYLIVTLNTTYVGQVCHSDPVSGEFATIVQ